VAEAPLLLLLQVLLQVLLLLLLLLPALAPATATAATAPPPPPCIDVAALRRWLSRRQMDVEGGFSGRCNKLVDSCYSFWQGGSWQLADRLQALQEQRAGSSSSSSSSSLPSSFDAAALARYVLCCTQAGTAGGCRDKPGKSRDFYHTCYALSGLALAQAQAQQGSQCGDAASQLQATCPVLNVLPQKVAAATAFFAAVDAAAEGERGRAGASGCSS
jgi:protein farnesyltransferase subunit beta